MQERVRGIRNTRKPSPKPTLEECVAILDEAASLPRPEEAPGGMYLDCFLAEFLLRQSLAVLCNIYCAGFLTAVLFIHSSGIAVLVISRDVCMWDGVRVRNGSADR